ncbi:MAG: amidohydrolase family protein [Gemmatimonadota bacterium]
MLAGLLACATSPAPRDASRAGEPFDVLVRGGRIVDGTGGPWFEGDVGIRGDRIVAVGRFDAATAAAIVDAAGCVVAPGFIDLLGQSEIALLVDGRGASKLTQGITTEVTGEGRTVSPLDPGSAARLEDDWKRFGLRVDWSDLDGYAQRLARSGSALNVATFVGAGQVWRAVIGLEDRRPTPAELEEMVRLVGEAMAQGSLGLSSALEYAPDSWLTTADLIALARPAAAAGGIYATHLRSESVAFEAALAEALRVGREAGLPVEIWHLKRSGRPYWGSMPEAVAAIDSARAGGQDVSADVYPYRAAATSLAASIPPWAHEGGDERLVERLADPAAVARIRREIEEPSDTYLSFYTAAGGGEGVRIASVEDTALRPLLGRRLSEVARERGEDPLSTLLGLVRRDPDIGAIYFVMDEADVTLAAQRPWVSFDTDYSASATDGPLSEDRPHPRAYGSYPKVLGEWVRERRLLGLEEAVRKMTSQPAARVGLNDRGLLRPGMAADVVVFDPETIAGGATFEDPMRYSRGVETVIVNGRIVLDRGEITDARPGRLLRGPGWRGR